MSILVYAENRDGAFKKSTFELISYASKIAEMSQTETIALSIGEVANEELEQLKKYGANKIVRIASENLKQLDNKLYTQAIAEAANKFDANVIILAHNNSGKALAPRLSARLKAGLAAAANKLPTSVEPFMIPKRVFSGNAFANLKINSDKKIITLLQNSYEIFENPKEATIEDMTIDGAMTIQITGEEKISGQIILTDAELVVSGGRGLKGPENWACVTDLAEALGAATACSRPVSDEGWRPHNEHTGQTGKIIAPNLYIAAGISGAIQHLAGVSSSKCIVAINKDADAPIFSAADYGIIGDAIEILPKITEAVKNIKNQ